MQQLEITYCKLFSIWWITEVCFLRHTLHVCAGAVCMCALFTFMCAVGVCGVLHFYHFVHGNRMLKTCAVNSMKMFAGSTVCHSRLPFICMNELFAYLPEKVNRDVANFKYVLPSSYTLWVFAAFFCQSPSLQAPLIPSVSHSSYVYSTELWVRFLFFSLLLCKPSQHNTFAFTCSV